MTRSVSGLSNKRRTDHQFRKDTPIFGLKKGERRWSFVGLLGSRTEEDSEKPGIERSCGFKSARENEKRYLHLPGTRRIQLPVERSLGRLVEEGAYGAPRLQFYRGSWYDYVRSLEGSEEGISPALNDWHASNDTLSVHSILRDPPQVTFVEFIPRDDRRTDQMQGAVESLHPITSSGSGPVCGVVAHPAIFKALTWHRLPAPLRTSCRP
eukprot:765715-Hanusia_phi.AAC.1